MQILIGYHRIDERVVVKLGVREEIVVGRPLTGLKVIPLLLQRNAEHGCTAGPVAHNLQEVREAPALLNVIGEVKVRVVEVLGGATARRVQENQHERRRNHESSDSCQGYPPDYLLHHHYVQYPVNGWRRIQNTGTNCIGAEAGYSTRAFR